MKALENFIIQNEFSYTPCPYSRVLSQHDTGTIFEVQTKHVYC